MPGIENYRLIGRLSVLWLQREEPLSAFSEAVLSPIALIVCAGISNQKPLLAVGLQTCGFEPVESARLAAIVARLCGRKGGKGV